MARFAVVGAGVTGLAAAWELQSAGADVVVYETGDRPGGKVASSDVPGLPFPLDDGADAFLARVPDALQLCEELGIDELVHPATGRAWVDTGTGPLRPLPRGQVLGVPADLDELEASGLVSADAVATLRADLDADWPAPTADESVGELVRRRLGEEVRDHLVEPLLGGINAGEADGLSASACAPQIWALAQQGGSLVRAAARARAAAATDAPVFAAPVQGMAEIPRRLAERLRAELRFGTPVSHLRTRGGAHGHPGRDRQIEVAAGGGLERYDGVVVAAPAHASAGLLAEVAPEAAELLATIDFASVVMVTIVADGDTVDHPLDGSGFVVARTANRSITACSWGSSKWPHWDDGRHVVFRASLGHDSDPTDWPALDDATLLRTARHDLEHVMAAAIEPVGVRIGRWPRSFPQYRPGHLDLVAAVRAAAEAAGPVAVAGASLGGIGVPACIRQGREAARRLLG